MKRALLIGNSEYENGQEILNFVVNDINNLEAMLNSVGYLVTKKMNINYKNSLELIEKFQSEILDGDTIVLYFSGHGFDCDGIIYTLCVDSKNTYTNKIAIIDENHNIISSTYVMKMLDKNEKGSNLIIYDCCRVIEKTSSMEPEPIVKDNINILYCTKRNSSAYDGSFIEAFKECFYDYTQTFSDLVSNINYYMENNNNIKKVSAS